MPLMPPDDSPYMVKLKRLIEILEADTELQMMFGWEDPPTGVTPLSAEDSPLRKRIFFDDNGSCDPAVSPKLCLTEFVQQDTFNLLGDGANADSDLTAQIAVVVYVYVDKLSSGEQEKILAGNLHYRVRQTIRDNVVEENGLWENLQFMGVSCAFDQAPGFRRAGAVVGVYSQERVTNQPY